ncbi:uncharacterized mitochondrial protein AtMg00810-like [Lolium perenne]|uniref:uncharacterized mitochondrial protein AtMg00810-like n=1 Tax=Lolium perenne TaxID=4522 RepID=UPI003A99F213
MYLLVYVDDIILVSSSQVAADALVRSLGADFAVKDLGRLHYFLGVEVSPRAAGLTMTQKKYSLELLQRAGMLKCKPIATPMSSTDKLTAVDVSHGLHIRPHPSGVLSVFSDADWAGSPDDRRSTGGYAVFYGSSLIALSARKQATVYRSSTEAEYKAVGDATAEIIWKQLQIKFISSKDQLADIFTKPLPLPQFEACRRNLTF